MTAAEVQEYLKEGAIRQVDDLIRDKIEEDLPPEVEDEREWNWLSLSGWANRRFNINTNDRELKKIGREGIYDYLVERATESIGRLDLSAAEKILAEDMPHKSLTGFVGSRFGIEIPPSEFAGKSQDEVREQILKALHEMYRQKEIEFPVVVGIHQYLALGNHDALADWANYRLKAGITADQIRNKSRDEIHDLLLAASERGYDSNDAAERIDKALNAAYGPTDGPAAETAKIQKPAELDSLIEWTRQELRSDLTRENLEALPKAAARRRLMEEVDVRFRPEMSQAERSVLLEFLDGAWKDHLYYMDHLRQGIGLMGYAQKDPKVEYKREGMRAYDSMWKRVAVEVTSAMFRLEAVDPNAQQHDMWEISSETHESAPSLTMSGPEGGLEQGMPQTNDPDAAVAVEPIRNFGNRVGRNDPCPCGSGKKFKNCCMKK